MYTIKTIFKRTLLLLVLSILVGINEADAIYPTDEILDMALIYQGGTHRPDWTEDELLPYVTHKFADGRIDWFFDSFLFFEFTDNWKIAFGYKYGSQNAKKTDWEWLLGRIFEKGKSLDALNSCIEKYKGIIGKPKFKHKIVLGIVSPITGQTDWGSLDGEALNFNNQEHQTKATKWYLDQLITKFNAENYNNLELTGFYWLEETTAKCGDLPKYISQYIHEKGKKFYWIPYWYAQGFDQWKDLGFDVAYLQPNHFFNKDILDSRLRDACRTAKQLGMAVEMEFDHNVLYENEDSYYARLETYIDAFEKYGVFESSSIAYYSGTKAILQMYNSPVIENTIILDRIANHILDRRERLSGVETTKNEENQVIVAGGKGEMRIFGEVKDIKVYSINGKKISEGEKNIICPSGVYIASIDGKSQMVIVK
ncbi:MAG: DUF4855 domain-containing protein [Muribaculaceae bacterium]|nr:DUF4855 domain-containing protein [Muribaculaceae bacterium]